MCGLPDAGKDIQALDRQVSESKHWSDVVVLGFCAGLDNVKHCGDMPCRQREYISISTARTESNLSLPNDALVCGLELVESGIEIVNNTEKAQMPSSDKISSE